MEFNCKFKCFFLIFLLLITTSCLSSAKKTFIRKNVDISYVKKVAVLTFENHSKHDTAGKILRDITITEILSMNIFDVVGKSLVDAAISEETGDEEQPTFDKETLKRIARKLKVDGLILGSVDSYEEKRDGNYSYPVVTLTLTLIDAKSGLVLWQTSGTKTGYSLTERLLGIKSKDINELSFKIVEQLLKTLK